MSRRLAEYLRTGNAQLLEYNFTGPAAMTGQYSAMLTTRMEKARAAWDDLMIAHNALWLDILDSAPKAYEEAKGLLDEVKNAPVEDCTQTLTRFKGLYRVIEKWVYVDRDSESKDLKLYLARLKELIAELIYICDEYDPNRTRIPEAPSRSRDDYEDDKKAGKGKEKAPTADMTFQPPAGQKKSKNGAPEPPKQGQVLKGRPGKDQAGPSSDDAKGAKPKGTKASPGAQNGKNDKNKKTAPKKKIKESGRQRSSVLEAFQTAAEVLQEDCGGLDDAFLAAGETLAACVEASTDSQAYVEIGESTPGQFPRLDLFVEWSVRGRPSDCYGYARLNFVENEGLVVRTSQDAIVDLIPLGEDLADADVARRVYSALDEVFDVSPRRIHSNARVAPALYRLIERRRRGEDLAEGAFAQILASLRPHLSLVGNVLAAPQKISLLLSEGFEDIFAYHYSWAVRTPLTHMDLPDELNPHNGSMLDPPPEDEEAEAELSRAEPYIRGARVSRDDGDGPGDEEDWPAGMFGSRGKEVLYTEAEVVKCKICRGNIKSSETQCPNCGAKRPKASSTIDTFGERREGAHRSYWTSGTIRIKLREGVVTVVTSGGDEFKVAPDTTDRALAERIGAASQENEGIESGHIVEGAVQLNRKDFAVCRENSVGTHLEIIQERKQLVVEPALGGVSMVTWSGKLLGSVKRKGRFWGYSTRRNGPWANATHKTAEDAAKELAGKMGLHEHFIHDLRQDLGLLEAAQRVTQSMRNSTVSQFNRVGLGGKGRFPKVGSALSAAFDVLNKFGIEPDESLNATSFMGPEGRRNISLAWTNKEDPFSPQSIPNSMLHVSWSKLEGGYEVIAYLT